MKRCSMHTWIGVVAASLLAVHAHADVVDIPGSKDNTLIQKDDGSLSNGAGEYFFAGNTAQSPDDWRRRGVIAFDIDGSIPAGSIINSVTLQLYMSRAKENTSFDTDLHRLTTDWGEGASDAPDNEGGGAPAEEGDATWLYTFYDVSDPELSPAWTNPGGDGDYSASSAVQAVGGNGFYTWTGAGLVADVQLWLDSPASNFGWIVIGDESQEKTAKRFNSRQFTGQSARLPKLTVDFTPPVPTGACCLPNGSCVVVTSETDCTNLGGTFEGIGSDCITANCPQPTGACCLSGGVCMVLNETDCLLQGGTYEGNDTTCDPNPCPLFLEPFVDELVVPQLATPISGNPGDVATYDMTMRETLQQVHRDLAPTTVWGFDDGTTGPVWPGPTILAGANDAVTVNWINDLRYTSGPNQGLLRTEHYLPVDLCPHGPNDPDNGDKPRTVVHLHGAHVQSRFDGYPEETFLPGEMATYVYPNEQLGATIWYHDHALGITRLNVQMGMAGAYVIQDATDLAVNLPSGSSDVPLILQDRTFNADGSISYPPVWQDHFFGEFALVNGTVQPFLDVSRSKYRFRLVNGCNSRRLVLGLTNGATMTVIATDGGLLDEPSPPQAEVLMGPGERVEVVVDFEVFPNGTEIILTNAEAPPSGAPLPQFMKFIVQGGGGFTDPLPASLRNNEVLLEGDAVQSRDFELRKDPESTPDCSTTWWLINGLEWGDITEYPELDTTEIWRFINPSGQMHPMHMHLVFFQVLDHQPVAIAEDGTVVPTGPAIPPGPTEMGWKDTVQVMPGTMTRVIARFEDFVGKYAYHCHILEHEDHEMMRQFQTLPNCPADVDSDGTVGVTDLLTLLAQWGACPEPCSTLGEISEPDTCVADVNRDCVVDVADLLTTLANWGPCQ